MSCFRLHSFDLIKNYKYLIVCYLGIFIFSSLLNDVEIPLVFKAVFSEVINTVRRLCSRSSGNSVNQVTLMQTLKKLPDEWVKEDQTKSELRTRLCV